MAKPSPVVPSVTDRLQFLKARHRSLESRLEQLNAQSHLGEQDWVEMANIKKRKLQLKDQMRMLENRGAADC